MVVSILLIAMGIVGLSALLYRFAVYALPALIGIATASWAFQSGAGMIGAFIVGVLSGGAVFALGQGLYASVRPAVLRALILLAFVLPAAYAGYSIVLQLTELGSLSPIWRDVFAVIGAIIVGCSAAIRLAGRESAVTVADPVRGLARQGQ